jgi:hypothetical protein
MDNYYQKTPIQERIENMVTNGFGYEPIALKKLNLTQTQSDHYFSTMKLLELGIDLRPSDYLFKNDNAPSRFRKRTPEEDDFLRKGIRDYCIRTFGAQRTKYTQEKQD